VVEENRLGPPRCWFQDFQSLVGMGAKQYLGSYIGQWNTSWNANQWQVSKVGNLDCGYKNALGARLLLDKEHGCERVANRQ